MINDLGILVSKEGELLENYFSFLFRSVRPMKVWSDIRFGNVGGKQWVKVIISDILASGFYNYVMGGVFVKGLYSYVTKIFNRNIKTKDKLLDSAYALIIGAGLFGTYRSIRDKDIAQMSPVEWFRGLVDSFSSCVGKDKVSDALTGRLYRNVIGSPQEADDPNAVVDCGDVEFSKAFLKTYSIQDEAVVKKAAEALYATLNNNAGGGNWWTIGDGKWYKQVPSVTKIIKML